MGKLRPYGYSPNKRSFARCVAVVIVKLLSNMSCTLCGMQVQNYTFYSKFGCLLPKILNFCAFLGESETMLQKIRNKRDLRTGWKQGVSFRILDRAGVREGVVRLTSQHFGAREGVVNYKSGFRRSRGKAADRLPWWGLSAAVYSSTGTNFSFFRLQRGQRHVSGRSSNWVPGLARNLQFSH